jgi:hypothetical protein
METNLAYPGFDPYVAPEGMADFDRVLLSNFLAVLMSSCAFAVSIRLKMATTSFAENYALERYQQYTTYLLIYFGLSVVINLAGALSFMVYRCVYHNLVSYGPGGMYTKLVYITSAIFSSLITNGIMDRLLLTRVRMLHIERNEKEAASLKCLDRATWVQIAMCLLLMGSGVFVLLTLIGRGGDGQSGSGLLMLVVLYRGAGFTFAMLHLFISVSIVRLLLRIAKSEQQGEARTLIAFTVLGVSSTVLVYLNWIVGFVNLYFLMPIDSVINDLCLAMVSFSAQTSDVQDARRVGVAEFALTVGQKEDSAP